MRLPTRIDRYPAKMVSRLADRLIDQYAGDATRLIDPFSGSGAILMAARRRDISVSGIDINPVASLFTSVKLNGFDRDKASKMALEWIRRSKQGGKLLPIEWKAKDFWFTPRVIDKFERLRFVGHEMRLHESPEGLALLLCFSLGIRLCSKADQRSPKPFISKQARTSRHGRHFDPYSVICRLLDELSPLYGAISAPSISKFFLADLARDAGISERIGTYSHIVTSPPYINAQDYFRNFKLELYCLEALLPFRVDHVMRNFIGTERGDLLREVPDSMLHRNRTIVPCLCQLERKDQRLAAVVHRYLSDMDNSFLVLRRCLQSGGSFVLVCGDNLIGGFRIRTWEVLHELLERQGFSLFDRFSDPICDRLLAPKRSGHKGLIKEEVVSAYQLS